MTREEEDYILWSINKALQDGPSTWHEATPEHMAELERRRRAKQNKENE